MDRKEKTETEPRSLRALLLSNTGSSAKGTNPVETGRQESFHSAQTAVPTQIRREKKKSERVQMEAHDCFGASSLALALLMGTACAGAGLSVCLDGSMTSWSFNKLLAIVESCFRVSSMGDQSSISASKQKAHKQAQTESTNLDTKKVKKTMVRKAVQPGSDGGKKK